MRPFAGILPVILKPLDVPRVVRVRMLSCSLRFQSSEIPPLNLPAVEHIINSVVPPITRPFKPRLSITVEKVVDRALVEPPTPKPGQFAKILHAEPMISKNLL